jgi:alanyl-tRNA synthetase
LIEQLAYLDDPLTLEFKAEIVQKIKSPNGHHDVLLKKTYFYPTGGGQAHDTGFLGPARVVDVFKDETGNVVHRLDRDISEPVVVAKIDHNRRLGHMQHHSAQHILSRALEEALGLESISAKISADTPSTIDIQAESLSPADLEPGENLANQIIFENRPIKTYFITDDQLQTIPFRRPPTVSGQIRVVEVDSFDYCACGGTHCPSAGMIGLIKIVKTENKGGKLRLHFVAGQQALTWFQTYHHLITTVSRHFNTSAEEVVKAVAQQTEQLQIAQRELKAMQLEILSGEAQKLVLQAETCGPYRLVLATFKDRTMADLRELGKSLQGEQKIVALLAGYDGQKLSLVVSCAEDTQVSAKELLARQLAQIKGRGGGDAGLAQGGGEATEQQVQSLLAGARDYIRILAER